MSRETLELAARAALRARLSGAVDTDVGEAGRGVVMPAAPTQTGAEPRAKYSDRQTDNILRLLGSIASAPVPPVTPETLCGYHAAVLEGAPAAAGSSVGELRSINVRVGNGYGALPGETPGMVEALLRWANDPANDPLPRLPHAGALIRAITVHVELLAIHPFVDGNGRVARATEFALLLRAGVPASIAIELQSFYNEDRTAYVRKLRESDGDDREAFLRYALRGLNRRLLERTLAGERRIGRRQLLRAAFTLVELVIVIMLLGILAGVAAPKLLGTGSIAQDAAEEQIVRNVREGIELFYLAKLGEGAGEFPDNLDRDSQTACSETSPCFAQVLKRGVSNRDWWKVDKHTYHAPSGRQYEYNPSTGEFLEL